MSPPAPLRADEKLHRLRHRRRGVSRNYVLLGLLLLFFSAAWLPLAGLLVVLAHSTHALLPVGIGLLILATFIGRRRWIRARDRRLAARLAAGDFPALIVRSPRTLAEHRYRALGLWHTGRQEEALAELTEMRQSGTLPVALIDHAAMLLERRTTPGSVEQAEQLLEQLEGILADDPLVTTLRTRADLIRGDLELAEGRLREGLLSWPGDTDLLAQLAAVQLEQGSASAAEQSLSQALRADPMHPHALILRSRLTGQPADRVRAVDALAARPGSLLTAELSDSRYRESAPVRVPQHLLDPDHLRVNRDMNGMDFEVSTWERLTPRLRPGWRLIAALAGGAVAVLGALALVDPSLMLQVLMWSLMSVFGLLGLAALVLILMPIVGRRFVMAKVAIDRTGMRIQTFRKLEKILWAECDAVQRTGRRIEVLRGGAWEQIPSPNAATDARWMEHLIAEQIAERASDPTAVPAEAAAALAKLTER